MIRIRVVAACVALVLLGSRTAAADPPGFAFLEVPSGARGAALGGAFTSLAQGVEAAFWNPAGLDAVKGVQMSGTHVEFVQKLRHDQFAVAGRAFGGGLAASVRALYSEPIDERDELGNLIGSFGGHDLELGLGYGRAVTPRLTVGASAQYLRERIADASAGTYSFGGGATWSARPDGLRLAAVADHLGPAAHYNLDGGPGAPVSLPAAVQAGASYPWAIAKNAVLRAALETRLTRGRSGIGMIGVELATPGGAKGAGAAALRAGLRLNDDATTYSLGVGYALPGLRLDYAFVPLRLDLGDTHRVSVTAQF